MIRLVSYVNVPRDAHRRKITRRAVFARDSWTCQYCGSRSNLTVDHVIPRSKGGTSSWENIVASCAPCNRRKGDRLPRQAGMHPRRAPRTPRAEIFIHVASPTIPAAWLQYLPAGRPPERARPQPRGGVDALTSRNDEGRRRRRRPSRTALTGKTEIDRCAPEGPGPAVVSGCPGLDSAKRSSLSDLAAGHLQGPARTVTQRLDHLLSLVRARVANGDDEGEA